MLNTSRKRSRDGANLPRRHLAHGALRMWDVVKITAIACALALALTSAARTQAVVEIDEPVSEVDTPDFIVEMMGESSERIRERADAGAGDAALALARMLLSDTGNVEAQTEGMRYLEQAADLGLVDAQIQFAAVLRNGGQGVAPDREKALNLLEAASAEGDPRAMAALGILLFEMNADSAAREHAFEVLEAAAAAGDVNAANFLGVVYVNGRGTDPDVEKGLAYLDIGLVSGNVSSLLDLGDIYRQGLAGQPASPDIAMALYAQAAERGNRAAERRIADMYLRGEGVTQDLSTAEAMLVDAAEQGDPFAFQLLGDIYAYGQFTSVDAQRAITYYERSHGLGNSGALVRLGDLYRADLPDLPADIDRSVAYYSEAIESGNVGALRTLANLLLDPNMPVVDIDRGVALLTDAAEAGDDQAALQLGQLYSSNTGPFLPDYDTAKYYFELASSLGNTDALFRMGNALASGPLAAAHRDEALVLLTDAVESGTTGAAADLARLQLAGAFPGRGADGVMSMLLDAARNGDVVSARYLIQLYRDGYGLLFQPDLDAAIALLDSLEPELGEEVTAMERILVVAKEGRSDSTLAAIASDFAHLSRTTGVDVLRQLRDINPHAYVHILQQSLSELGFYSGPIHGLLDTTTIRAVSAACAEAGATQQCNGGPLTDGTALVLGNFIFDTQTPA